MDDFYGNESNVLWKRQRRERERDEREQVLSDRGRYAKRFPLTNWRLVRPKFGRNHRGCERVSRCILREKRAGDFYPRLALPRALLVRERGKE